VDALWRRLLFIWMVISFPGGRSHPANVHLSNFEKQPT
jgi:hypothetical protein